MKRKNNKLKLKTGILGLSVGALVGATATSAIIGNVNQKHYLASKQAYIEYLNNAGTLTGNFAVTPENGVPFSDPNNVTGSTENLFINRWDLPNHVAFPYANNQIVMASSQFGAVIFDVQSGQILKKLNAGSDKNAQDIGKFVKSIWPIGNSGEMVMILQGETGDYGDIPDVPNFDGALGGDPSKAAAIFVDSNFSVNFSKSKYLIVNVPYEEWFFSNEFVDRSDEDNPYLGILRDEYIATIKSYMVQGTSSSGASYIGRYTPYTSLVNGTYDGKEDYASEQTAKNETGFSFIKVDENGVKSIPASFERLDSETPIEQLGGKHTRPAASDTVSISSFIKDDKMYTLSIDVPTSTREGDVPQIDANWLVGRVVLRAGELNDDRIVLNKVWDQRIFPSNTNYMGEHWFRCEMRDNWNIVDGFQKRIGVKYSGYSVLDHVSISNTRLDGNDLYFATAVDYMLDEDDLDESGKPNTKRSFMLYTKYNFQDGANDSDHFSFVPLSGFSKENTFRFRGTIKNATIEGTNGIVYLQNFNFQPRGSDEYECDGDAIIKMDLANWRSGNDGIGYGDIVRDFELCGNKRNRHNTYKEARLYVRKKDSPDNSLANYKYGVYPVGVNTNKDSDNAPTIALLGGNNQYLAFNPNANDYYGSYAYQTELISSSSINQIIQVQQDAIKAVEIKNGPDGWADLPLDNSSLTSLVKQYRSDSTIHVQVKDPSDPEELKLRYQGKITVTSLTIDKSFEENSTAVIDTPKTFNFEEGKYPIVSGYHVWNTDVKMLEGMVKKPDEWGKRYYESPTPEFLWDFNIYQNDTGLTEEEFVKKEFKEKGIFDKLFDDLPFENERNISLDIHGYGGKFMVIAFTFHNWYENGVVHNDPKEVYENTWIIRFDGEINSHYKPTVLDINSVDLSGTGVWEQWNDTEKLNLVKSKIEEIIREKAKNKEIFIPQNWEVRQLSVNESESNRATGNIVVDYDVSPIYYEDGPHYNSKFKVRVNGVEPFNSKVKPDLMENTFHYAGPENSLKVPNMTEIKSNVLGWIRNGQIFEGQIKDGTFSSISENQFRVEMVSPRQVSNSGEFKVILDRNYAYINGTTTPYEDRVVAHIRIDGFSTRNTRLKSDTFTFADFFGTSEDPWYLAEKVPTPNQITEILKNKKEKFFDDPVGIPEIENLTVAVSGNPDRGVVDVEFDCTNAYPERAHFKFSINGFKVLQTALISQSIEVTPEWASYSAEQSYWNFYSYNDADILGNEAPWNENGKYKTQEYLKQIIVERKDSIYSNLDKNFSTSDIRLNDPNINGWTPEQINNRDGIVVVRVTLLGHYHDPSGKLPINNVWLSISGFRTEGLTTELMNKEFTISTSGAELQSVDTLNEDDVVNGKYTTDIKRQIADNGIFQNLAQRPINALDPVNVNDIEIAGITGRNSKEGSINVRVNLKNGKGWIDGTRKRSVDLGADIKISGFRPKVPTEFKSDAQIAVPSKWAQKSWAANASENNITGGQILSRPSEQAELQSFVSQYFKNEGNTSLKDAVVGLPDEFYEGNIDANDWFSKYATYSNFVPNNKEGTITFELGLKKYIDLDDSGDLVTIDTTTDPSKPIKSGIIKLTGFHNNNIDTTLDMNSNDSISGATDIPVFAWKKKEQEIKTLLVNRINNLPYDVSKVSSSSSVMRLNPEDIELIDTVPESDGSIRTKVKVTDASKIWIDGIVQPSSNSHIFANEARVGGFKPIAETKVKQESFNSSEFSNYYASKESYDPEKVKNWIKSNETTVFQGVPTEKIDGTPLTQAEVWKFSDEEIQYDLTNGRLTIKVLFNYYYDDQLIFHDVAAESLTPKEMQVVLSGFKTDGIGTTLNGGDFNIPALSDTIASNWASQEDLLKATIRGAIINPAYGKSITNEDIEFFDPNPNNIARTLNIKVKLKNSKYWDANGQVSPEFSFPSSVVFTGFAEVRPLKVISQEINDPSFANIFANEEGYPKESVETFLNDNKNKVFDATTLTGLEHITCDQPVYTVLEGKITTNLTITNFVDDNGIQQESNTKTIPITLTGFISEASRFTTQFDTSTELNLSLSDTLPTEWKTKQTEVLTGLVPRFINIANNKVVDPATDIEIVEELPNNLDGSLTLKVKLNGNKYWANAVVEPSHTFDAAIKIIGFKQQQPTALKDPDAKYTDASFESIFADKKTFTTELAQTFIDNNKENIFQNLAPDSQLSVEEIVTIDSSITSGELSIKVSVTNYYNAEGVYEANKKPELFEVKLSGFKKDQLTTIFDNNTFDAGFAEVIPTNWRSVEQDIKSKLLPKFTNIAFGETITSGDIEIVNDASLHASNLRGELTFKVKLLNSKYWKQGVVEETHIFDETITLTGFKIQPQTTIVPEANRTINLGLRDRFTSQYLETEAKQYIFSNREKFFDGLPNATSFEEQFELESFDNTKVATGTITFTLRIKKYFNEQGEETVGADGPSGEFKFIGFKDEGFTTELDNSKKIILTNVGSIFADDIDKHKSQVRQAIFDNVKEKIKYLADGAANSTLNVNDLEYEVMPNTTDNTKGEIKVKLFLKNRKGWINALVQDSMSLNDAGYTLSGFDKRNPTSQIMYTIDISKEMEWVNKTVLDYTDQKAAEHLNAKKTEIFSNLPEGAEIKVVSQKQNLDGGSTEVKIQLTKYIDNSGNIKNELSPEYTITITNFYHTDLTTIFQPNAYYKIDAKTISPTNWSQKSDDIKNLILNAFRGLVPGQTVQPQDIEFYDDKPNVVEGQVELKVKLLNNKGWERGVPQTAMTFGETKVIVKGFNTQRPTTAIQASQTLTDVSFKDIINKNYSEEQAKTLIYNRRSSLYTDLPAGSSFDDTFRLSGWTVSEPTTGQITFDIQPLSYYNNDGVLSNDSNGPIVHITLAGFKTTGLTTKLEYAKEITVPAEVGNIVPSEFNISDTARTNKLKELIIPRIINPYDTVTADDISLKIHSADNPTGKLNVEVTLSGGKYWENGTPKPTHTFTREIITFAGFQKQNGTYENPQFNNIQAKQEDRNLNTLQYDQEKAKTLIFENRDRFFTNLPKDGVNAFDDIFEIASNGFDNSSQISSGSVWVTIKLKKYYDNKGVLQNSNYPKTYKVIISGFNTNNITTRFDDEIHNKKDKGIEFAWLSDKVVSPSIMPEIEERLKLELYKHVINPYNGATIESSDLLFDRDITAIRGTDYIIINKVYVTNNKGWTNGVPANKVLIETKLKITGFKNPENETPTEETKFNDVVIDASSSALQNHLKNELRGDADIFTDYNKFIKWHGKCKSEGDTSAAGVSERNKLWRAFGLADWLNLPRYKNPAKIPGTSVVDDNSGSVVYGVNELDVQQDSNDTTIETYSTPTSRAPNTFTNGTIELDSENQVANIRGLQIKVNWVYQRKADGTIEKVEINNKANAPIITFDLLNLKWDSGGGNPGAGVDQKQGKQMLYIIIGSVSAATLLLIILLTVLIVKKKQNDEYIKDDDDFND